MSEAIIVALIGMLGIILAALIGLAGVVIQSNRKANKEKVQAKIEQAKRDQMLSDKLEAITVRLDEHNGYAQKYAETHDDIIVMKKDIEILRDYVKSKQK